MAITSLWSELVDLMFNTQKKGRKKEDDAFGMLPSILQLWQRGGTDLAGVIACCFVSLSE